MFAHRETWPGVAGQVEIGFTDAGLDLKGLRPGFAAEFARLETAAGVTFARLSQVHGDDVVVVSDLVPPGLREDVAFGDALVTDRPGIGLMVRAADCIPLVLADADAGVLGVAHAGRPGVAVDVATRTVEAMRGLGAERIDARIGPHVCGDCYEVPEEMRADVASRVPATWATTSWGTPSLDLAAGVRAQLEASGVTATEVGGCTREQPDLHSYRRDGAASGRHAGLVWRR